MVVRMVKPLTARSNRGPPLPSDEATSRLSVLSQFPSDETAVEGLLDEIEDDAFTAALVKTFAEDERTFLRNNYAAPGLRLRSFNEQLLDRGLVERLSPPYDEIVQLTPRGRTLGSLLLAPGEPPSSLAARVMQLRHQVDEFERQARSETEPSSSK
jgi:hypothetical protein